MILRIPCGKLQLEISDGEEVGRRDRLGLGPFDSQI